MKISELLVTEYINNVQEEFEIYNGNFSIIESDAQINIQGKVYLSLRTSPIIFIEGEADSVNRDWFNSNKLILNIPGFEKTQCYIYQLKNQGGRSFIKARVLNTLESKREAHFDSCILHVVNLFNFRGNATVETEKFIHSFAEIIENDEWYIAIQARSDYKKNNIFKELKDLKNFRITHLIEIKKHDRSPFYLEEAEKIKEKLTYLFSFITGRNIGIPIILGNLEGRMIMKKFSSPIISPYKGKNNWFPMQRTDTISDLYVGLERIYMDKFHYETFKGIVHWYVSSETDLYLENKTISAQIALEQLSFFLLTQTSSPKLSKKKFKNNSFKQNLEEVLSLSGSPQVLQEYERKDLFKNGPEALVTLRNHIAHPEPNKKLEQTSTLDHVHIKQLAVYYVELLTLFFLDYKGEITNRRKFPLWEGEYEKVPWNEHNL